MMEKWRRKGGMNLKKDYLLLILNIILIVCFVLVNLLNQTIFIIDSNIMLILSMAGVIIVAVWSIAYLEKYKLGRLLKTKTSGRLYFKRREFYGKIWRFIFKIEVGLEMLEFFVPPDLYDSVEKGSKVYFGYDLVGEDYRWITWIESYR